MSATDALRALVDVILEDVEAAKNPFFTALHQGTFERGDFLETQLQFYEAVAFFHRPMATLASRIPDPSLRTEILRNVWEENGEGDPAATHAATFVTFLSRLSERPEEEIRTTLGRRATWPEVDVFNTVLMGACATGHVLVGTAVLGVIEHMFAAISAWIGNALVDRGFLAAEDMVHYELHAELDVKHAADFFAILSAAWDDGPAARRHIERGLRMGATAFDQLFARLYRHRHRRWAGDPCAS